MPRSHKDRGLATCRRIKIDAMIAVELRCTARNSSNFEDSFLRTASIDIVVCSLYCIVY